MEQVIHLTPEQAAAYAVEFDRRWRERTPSTNIYDALPSSRVTFSDMNTWFLATYRVPLSPLARIDIADALRPVFKRLRKEFPNEQW